eukprot:jgi/Undpi1/9724/HiC_scaffold_27.g12180.m1
MFLSTPRADPSPGVDEWHRRARTAAQRLYGTPPTALPAPLCLVSRLSTGLAGQARSDRLDELPWARGGGTDMAVLATVPAPPALFSNQQAGSPPAREGELDTAVLWLVPEPPAYPPDKRVGTPSAKGGESDTSVLGVEMESSAPPAGRWTCSPRARWRSLATPELWAVPEYQRPLRISGRARREPWNVEGLAVGHGRGVGCDGNLGGAGALGARYSQTRSSWVLEGIPGTAEL